MQLADVEKMSLGEKFELMELLWTDMRTKLEGAGISQAHRDLLDSRRDRVAKGVVQLRNWEDVKDSLGRRKA